MKFLVPKFSLPRRHATAGSSLAATMCVVLAILSFLSIAGLMTTQFGRYAGRQRGSSDAMTGCDAALEYAYAQWKTAVYNGGGGGPAPNLCGPATMATTFNNVYGSASGFAKSGVVCPSPSPGASPSIIIYSSDPNGLNLSPTASPSPVPTSNVPGYPGWSGKTYNYMAQATVASPTHFGYPASVVARRFFQVTSVPLFQAAIFYENKLEIHPGDAMKVTGLVHTNNDLWAQGFSTLQFMSNVSFVGAFHQAADSSVTNGWDGYGARYFPAASQQLTWSDGSTYGSPLGSTSQLNQVSAINPFGNDPTSNNGLHAIVEVPPTGNTSSEYAYNSASLIITVNTAVANNAAGRYTITDGSGNALPAVDYANVLAAIGGSTNASATTTASITDMREGSAVTVTNLDMTKLASAAMPLFPPGGVLPVDGQPPLPPMPVVFADTWQSQFALKPTVYIQDVGGTTSSSRRAIRLVNGSNLYQNVSVVSNNGMYIQGDYNTGGSASNPVPSDQASNTNGAALPTASGYTRLSSAVMADAVTVLSNNWNDAYSGNTLAGDPLNNYSGSATTGRVATPTTVNTAILAGDVPSNLNGDGIASGGAHNFPRLLEDWTGKDFTYYGSLVEAFHSTKYTGNWQTGNVYTWPVRMWNFDTNFTNNPPPGSTTGLVFSRGRYQRIEN